MCTCVTSGGALLAKYSYKKLSQTEAEFIAEECGGGQHTHSPPIVRPRSPHTHTPEEEEGAGLGAGPAPSEMSCSEGGSSGGAGAGSSGGDSVMPDYDFSVHYPATLREEDCDWGECWIHCR